MRREITEAQRNYLPRFHSKLGTAFLVTSPFIVVLTIPCCISTLFIKWKTVLTVSHSHVFPVSYLFYVLCSHWSSPHGRSEWEHSSPQPLLYLVCNSKRLPTTTLLPLKEEICLNFVFNFLNILSCGIFIYALISINLFTVE